MARRLFPARKRKSGTATLKNIVPEVRVKRVLTNEIGTVTSQIELGEPLLLSRGRLLPATDRLPPHLARVRNLSMAQRPVVRSTRGIDYQDVARPVAGLSDVYGPTFCDPRHTHKRAQLLFADTGVITVTTDTASFVVPPQRAAWIPAGTPHEVQCRGRVSVHTVYVDVKACDGLSSTCRVLEVSGLLRELIMEVIRSSLDADVKVRDSLVIELVLNEIVAAPSIRLHVPMPQDPRLVKVCRCILDDPAQDDTLGDWAKLIGMGRRTFTRVFRKETYMSFADWRQHVRLMEALSRLASGEPVLTVSLDVGYSSPSAFSAMFRRVFGVAPRQYLKRGGESALSS